MNQRILGLILVFIATINALKVPLTIYYESLCPDSAKFINEQVYVVGKSELKDYIDITWVPFGKSEYSTRGSDVLFNCHHGPNECYGNKVHACAIEHIQSNSYQTEFTRESLTLDFINCMMSASKVNFPDNLYPGARCARENHISTWENIQQCANGTEGSALLKKHGEATNRFQNPLLSVPTIVFRQQYDIKDNQRAMTNFLGALCHYVPLPQPRICLSQNGGSSNTFTPTLIIGALIFYSLRFVFVL